MFNAVLLLFSLMLSGRSLEEVASDLANLTASTCGSVVVNITFWMEVQIIIVTHKSLQMTAVLPSWSWSLGSSVLLNE